jgi:hypothetical protein
LNRLQRITAGYSDIAIRRQKYQFIANHEVIQQPGCSPHQLDLTRTGGFSILNRQGKKRLCPMLNFRCCPAGRWLAKKNASL